MANGHVAKGQRGHWVGRVLVESATGCSRLSGLWNHDTSISRNLSSDSFLTSLEGLGGRTGLVLIGKGITEGLRDLLSGSAVSHFKPFSLFTVKLDKASIGAGFSDLTDNALDKFGLGLLGGFGGRVSGQYRLDNAAKTKVATVFVADLSSSNNHIQIAGRKATSKVGNFVVGHDRIRLREVIEVVALLCAALLVCSS